MNALATIDNVALVVFIAAWAFYPRLVARGAMRRGGLNMAMDRFRRDWMLQMAERDVRIVDASIMGTLQAGAAFFASTSLLALGGAATFLRATDDALKVFGDLPLAVPPTRSQWELKLLGLAAIFGYAFFKFAWSYRLFNYGAVLIGATPTMKDGPERARRHAARAAEMIIVAARNFTHGQRAFFFAIAYLGWFVSPYAFMALTGGVLYVMWARQFLSDAALAATLDHDGPEP